jgi:hypothetical protein
MNIFSLQCLTLLCDRALHNTTRRERRHFFRNTIGCRRRMANKWEETPLAKIFALPDQFSMLKQRAYAGQYISNFQELAVQKNAFSACT